MIYTIDGTKKLKEGTAEIKDNKATISVGNKLKKGQEGVLQVTITQEEETYYYYTRVLKDQDYHVKECLDYVMELHKNMLEKKEEDSIKKVMEPNSKGNNSTLQKVTIHSNLKHSMWGELKPEVISDIQVSVKEARSAYTSVMLQYRVACAGDNNEEEIYFVNEFFKVSYGTKRVLLLDYERTMEELFETDNVVLSSKGVILGLAKEDAQYKVNEENTIVAFEQANALWAYNKSEDTFTKIFGFYDGGREDVRNYTSDHSIRILSMEEEGNITFSVSGYMNRGEHEGESGVVIYYYGAAQKLVEEVAFIPSTLSQKMIESELNELAYYNKEQEQLYVMADGTLLKISTKKNKQEILMEGLKKDQYVSSEDGFLLAYQQKTEGKEITEIWDFSEDAKWEVPCEAGETIVPLGFLGNDFVYGITKPEDAGVDVSGSAVQAMHRLEIRNDENELVKTYSKKGVYITGATLGNNMITLRQATKEGNRYTEAAEDYITNSEAAEHGEVERKSYWTDLKETQYRILFSKGIKDQDAKIAYAKIKASEKKTTLEYEVTPEEYYLVYGHGKQVGVYREAGEAVAMAESLSGVVVSSKQNYVWEADNRVAWYRNFEVDRFSAKDGESTLTACIRKVLQYEGKKGDLVSELGTKSVQEFLTEQLETEAIRFGGCSVKTMFYLIDKGVPIIAMKDGSNAILLIGYDAKTVTYVEPSSASIFTSSIEKVDEMLAGSGRTFIGYVR